MSVIIYIKRVYVEHRHLTDIYTIVSIILFFFFFFFISPMHDVLSLWKWTAYTSTTTKSIGFNVPLFASHRYRIHAIRSSSLPLLPFFTIVLAHSSKKFIKFVVRYRAEDIDAWFNPFTIFNNGINGAKVDYIDL